MKKKKKGNLIHAVLLLGSLAVMALALSKLIPVLLDYQTSKKVYQRLDEDFVHVDDVKPDTGRRTWWSDSVCVNFKELKKENPDIVAWIRFDNLEDVNVSYPVLYSGDDEKYLRSDIYGAYHIAGCIFLEGENTPDFSDPHSIIYGHNMRNSTMFGDLKRYKNQEGFYEKNQFFTIYTETEALRYRIFSYHDVEDTSAVYTVGFTPGREFLDFAERMAKASIKDTGIKPAKGDKIVTLSTCSEGGETKRFVLHAVLTDKQKNNAK